MKNIVVTALFILSASQSFGSPVGSVAGTVRDPTGGVIPSVKLTLTNTTTNAQSNTTTNPEGEFQFPQLAPSTYKLTAEAQGFKKSTVSSVLVQVDQVTHVDLVLEVGNVTGPGPLEAVA